MSLTFRRVSIVEGEEVDAWLARQAALELADAAAAHAEVSWRAAYQLLGGILPDERVQRRHLERQ